MDEIVESGPKIETGKAPGPDWSPPEAIKISVEEMLEILLRITNELLQLQQFPDEWKIARLVLIWKAGKPIEHPTSFRPLCMLNVICKLFESMIKTRIEQELEEQNAISKYQYGFRKGRSTTDAMRWVVDRAKQSKSKWVALILIDIKNAFNTANWDKILTAMEEKKISGYLINITSSYLNNRSITITKGEHMYISQDVPQGSVLGPTLWSILYDGILNL
ncbi:MAG: RNA-directed DNA polymerase [Candidatus Hodgkinia cicadicola]